MAVIKCKMCGGDLILTEGQTVAECEYCGSRQTVPTADSEKKLVQFERAERLRKNCEFDKAAGIYESIVSEFRTESEAYWGLFLCKYGIEYVDDPATGKKIPTCHRSSFDSVMEDSDLEQALENADAIARKVYREEAKQIEEIRKGIIEVSGKEEPYDIFICYKETDENGERTIDSVIAQDVYDALTDKGYRVFFSRITLEDKLGQEYEPYIFAALNSAKIMLAFGTDYEYFNAVWVKNEWSRYLKLMAKDKTKHLIPCYKGLDAYDMPKEFVRLQAQDMGKVGAIQDLLRGIEKLLPKGEPAAPPVREAAPVESTGSGSRIASLLDRGSMALEDGDWAKADSFFEDVLNNDSKNAQAYIGKALAQEKCRTLDALIRKRKEATQNDSTEKLSLERDTKHIEEAAQRYSIPGYVGPDGIRALYNFDLSYPSGVSHRKRQYSDEESWWENHRWLSRAEKFASGAVAQTLREEKQRLFAQLAERVKKAQEADADSVVRLEAAYDAYITEADAKAETLYNEGIARREKDYQTWLSIVKTTGNIPELKQAGDFFKSQGTYKDSENLAEHCRKRIADEQAKIDDENEHKRIVAEKAAAARKKRNIFVIILCAIIAAGAIVVFFVLTNVIIPNKKYIEAQKMLAAGKYQQAIDAFAELNEYKDADVYLKQAKYLHGIQLESDGEYEAAYRYWEELGDYEDVKEHLKSYAVYPRKITSDGSTQEYTYDAQGRILKEKWIIYNFNETITNYEYDSQGRCIKETAVVTSLKDGGGSTSTIKYEYDETGRLVKSYENTSYGYNAIREYSYDAQGNCTQLITMHDGEIISTRTYHYDSDGNCVKYEDNSSTVVYTYDNGLCIRREATVNSGTTITEYHYDEDEQLIREDICKENGKTRTIEYSYDLAGKLIETTEINGNKSESTRYLDYLIVYQPVKPE